MESEPDIDASLPSAYRKPIARLQAVFGWDGETLFRFAAARRGLGRVGLGQLTHVVAGAVEVFYLPFRGAAGFAQVLGRYVAPAFVGNVIGGVTLTAALNHAQVVAGGARSKAR